MKTSLEVKVMEQNVTNNHQAHYVVNKVYINEWLWLCFYRLL